MIRRILPLLLRPLLLAVTTPVPMFSSFGRIMRGKIPMTTSSGMARSHFLAGRQFVDNLRLTDAIADFQESSGDRFQFRTRIPLSRTNGPRTPDSSSLIWRKPSNSPLGFQKVNGCGFSVFVPRASGDPASQKSYLTKLVAAFPEDERAHTLLGILHFGLQEYAEAVAVLNVRSRLNRRLPPHTISWDTPTVSGTVQLMRRRLSRSTLSLSLMTRIRTIHTPNFS